MKGLLGPAVLVCAAAGALSAHAGAFAANGCRVAWGEREVTVANALFARRA